MPADLPPTTHLVEGATSSVEQRVNDLADGDRLVNVTVGDHCDPQLEAGAGADLGGGDPALDVDLTGDLVDGG